LLEGTATATTLSFSRMFCSYISNVLSRNSTLEEVDISKNFISSKKAKLIFSALKFNSTLRVLNISENDIEEEALASLNSSK
jgi:Ran GTPase-activating protein (RanGAP) involved in mRNA processing and transport